MEQRSLCVTLLVKSKSNFFSKQDLNFIAMERNVTKGKKFLSDKILHKEIIYLTEHGDTCNPAHNIREFYKVLVQFPFTTSKPEYDL